MADFMRIKNENPRLKQSEIADRLGYSSSTLQRYRNGVNIFSPYRIQPNDAPINEQKRPKMQIFRNNSHHDRDLKRPQMTSNDFEKQKQKCSKSWIRA